MCVLSVPVQKKKCFPSETTEGLLPRFLAELPSAAICHQLFVSMSTPCSYIAHLSVACLPFPSTSLAPCAVHPFFPCLIMPRSAVGLPSSPRPPNTNRPASSASHHNSLRDLSAGPSGMRNEYQRYRSIHSIPLHGRYPAPRPAASERLRTSSQWANRQDMPFPTISPHVERRKINQPRVNTRCVNP
jgi:hypothetical protein